MPKILLRPLDKIAEKWGKEAQSAAPYYEAGVKEPLKDWADHTVAAAPVYKAAVTAPNIDKLFVGGVKRVGTSRWQNRAVNLGVPRYAPGVAASIDWYQNSFSPYYEELSRIELPERGPRGSDQNLERVRVIMKALFQKRLAVKGAGT